MALGHFNFCQNLENAWMWSQESPYVDDKIASLPIHCLTKHRSIKLCNYLFQDSMTTPYLLPPQRSRNGDSPCCEIHIFQEWCLIQDQRDVFPWCLQHQIRYMQSLQPIQSTLPSERSDYQSNPSYKVVFLKPGLPHFHD
jgi:hypothetical protein